MDLTALIDDIVAAMTKETERGTVASYIPELAKVRDRHRHRRRAAADRRRR